MSVKNNFYISFGGWLIILPLLGIPGLWRNGLVMASGVFLILLLVGPILLKKLQTKNKVIRKKKITHPLAPSLTTREGEGEGEVIKYD